MSPWGRSLKGLTVAADILAGCASECEWNEARRTARTRTRRRRVDSDVESCFSPAATV